MPGYGRKKIKSMVLFVVVAFMFLAVDCAYGLGGGGHHGDGRLDFSQSGGNGNGSPTNSNAQDPPNVSNCNTGCTDNGPVLAADPFGVSLPEPVTAILLGLGVGGLAGLRRKFRK